uniref:Trk system potassium uptake protein TrkA n=1 Tax=Desulfobacca acetoxidans TaxID=60893 RepID=A0A7V4LDD5_9BACT
MKVIIVGAGEIGFHFAEWLAQEKKEVVIIDISPEALMRVSDHLDVQILQGSGSNPRILEEAGLKHADLILAVTDKDEVNITACLFANIIAPHIQKVALIRNPDYTSYQAALSRDILHIGLVINPEREVVNSILRIVSAPDVEEVNDFMGGRIKMLSKHLSADSPLTGLKLMELPQKIERNRMIIAALVREEQLIIPKGKDTLKAGDFVYFVCQGQDIEEILGLFGKKTSSLKNILVVGGGNIGFPLAKELEARRFNVKLIEKDPQRCQMISAKLNRTIVLHGLATDQKFLEQENIGHMDLVVAVTWDEEMNILSSLLAKQLGAKKTIARVNKVPYIPLVQAIGIDHIVSPRLSAINSLFPYIRRGKVISSVSIRGKAAEVLEAEALAKSAIVGRPLKDLEFPKDALFLCVFRGEEVIIPSGDTRIEPGDRVLILSTGAVIPQVEQALMGKR